MDNYIVKLHNCLNELELTIRNDSAVITVEWFREMYSNHVSNIEWHHHTGTEIHYMKSGSVRFLFRDHSTVLSPGEVIVIPPNLVHKLEDVEEGKSFVKIVINFRIQPLTSDSEMEFTRTMLNSPQAKSFILDEYAKQLLFIAVSESMSRKYGFLTVIKSNILSFLSIVARQVADSPGIDYAVLKKTNINNERMKLIEGYILNKIAENITVEDIALYMNMSTKQVGRIIHSCCMESPSSFIMNIKVDKAKKLLKDPNNSVGDVSELLGFSNEYYFNRFFKRIEGLPPGKYRNSVNGVSGISV